MYVYMYLRNRGIDDRHNLSDFTASSAMHACSSPATSARKQGTALYKYQQEHNQLACHYIEHYPWLEH